MFISAGDGHYNRPMSPTWQRTSLALFVACATTGCGGATQVAALPDGLGREPPKSTPRVEEDPQKLFTAGRALAERHWDYEGAAKLLARACQQDHADSCHLLGKYHLRSDWPSWSGARGMELLQTACNLGHPEACYDHALYLRGRDDEATVEETRDAHARAANEVEHACELGWPSACDDAATLYLHGWDVNQDEQKSDALSMRANQLRRERCQAGDVGACQWLSPPDTARANELLSARCEQREAAACLELDPPQSRRALSLYRQRCAIGEVDGCYETALLLDGGKAGLTADLDEAAVYWRRTCALRRDTDELFCDTARWYDVLLPPHHFTSSQRDWLCDDCPAPTAAAVLGPFASPAEAERALRSLEPLGLPLGYPVVVHTDQIDPERKDGAGILLVAGLFRRPKVARSWLAEARAEVSSLKFLALPDTFPAEDTPGLLAATRVAQGAAGVVYGNVDEHGEESSPLCRLQPNTILVVPLDSVSPSIDHDHAAASCTEQVGLLPIEDTMLHVGVVLQRDGSHRLFRYEGRSCDMPYITEWTFDRTGICARVPSDGGC